MIGERPLAYLKNAIWLYRAGGAPDSHRVSQEECAMTRMSSSEAFVETLLAHGVKHIFGIVGSAYMDALDLFEPAGIRFISVAHEQGAGHMADGYSRVGNRPGVCIAQNGPGSIRRWS
jgi:Thiamine pyrophosphate enzyme, N-terminal TPP binding domain